MEKFIVEDIPAVLWGEPSAKIYIYVHGKHGYKEWNDKQVQMIREGHGKYILKYQGRDVCGTRKSVEKRNGEYVIHDNHY